MTYPYGEKRCEQCAFFPRYAIEYPICWGSHYYQCLISGEVHDEQAIHDCEWFVWDGVDRNYVGGLDDHPNITAVNAERRARMQARYYAGEVGS